MNKGEFVGEIPVQSVRGGPVMILSGDPDNWVCAWNENGTTVTKTFQPEQLQRAALDANYP